MYHCLPAYVLHTAGLPAGLMKKNTKKPTLLKEKNPQFRRKKKLLFILKSSSIMFIRQNVRCLHVYEHTDTH